VATARTAVGIGCGMVGTSWGDVNCKARDTSCSSGLVGTVTVQPSSNDSGRSGRAREEPRLLRTVLREVWRQSARTGACAVSGRASVSDPSKWRSFRRCRFRSFLHLVSKGGCLIVAKSSHRDQLPDLINSCEWRGSGSGQQSRQFPLLCQLMARCWR
jgi:hypothetical protein